MAGFSPVHKMLNQNVGKNIFNAHAVEFQQHPQSRKVCARTVVVVVAGYCVQQPWRIKDEAEKHENVDGSAM